MNMNSGEYQKWLMERMYMTRSSPKHINKLKRPQTGVRVYKMKNYSSGTSPRKTYMFNNHAWTKWNQSLIKKPKIHKENSIDIKSDINKEQLNSVSQSESQVNSQSNKSHNRIWRSRVYYLIFLVTKQAQAHNSSQIYQLTSFQKKKLRKNFETIINAHNKDVVQYPFKGTYNPIEVVNNHTLFKRTRQKHSIGYHQSNDKVLLNNASKTIESSFGSNFPFFTNSDQKSVDYDSIYNPTQKSDRAKTPALNSINSQMIDPAYRASPKGILKKPHTAYGGR